MPAPSAPTAPLIQSMLARRGLTDPSAIAAFLTPDFDTQLHDPFLLHQMDVAVARLAQALVARERIALYGDYDCDGIPGTVVLYDCLRTLGHEAVTTYIPHRHYEGFGFTESAAQKLHTEGVTLIVTIDCGTTDHAAVAAARALGIDVIITDHHEPKETLPEAVAVVNPKLGAYPFTDLCGAAVAFKLAQALLARVDHAVPSGKEKWWLDMVGLATIADMVPLLGENRVFAHFGLTVLRKSRRPGLVHLLRRQRAHQRYLTEDDIGFTIGPRLNAASRMDAPEEAFRLLATTDEATAAAAVAHLERLNNERKGVVAAMVREAHGVLRQHDGLPPVIVLGNPQWRPALVGLVAGKLAEEHQRPAFVWGRDGNQVLKGSARGAGGASVIDLMTACADVFVEFGGHHASGGFTVRDTAVHELLPRLMAAHDTLAIPPVTTPVHEVDATLTLPELTPELVRQVMSLAPFGVGNPKPRFAFKNVVPDAIETFGKAREHTRVRLRAGTGRIDGIAFFTTPEAIGFTSRVPAPTTLIAELEQSYFMGRRETRLRLISATPTA